MLSGAEIALVALRKTRLEELLREGRGAARAVERLRADPERFLATVQVGITVVGATASAFGGARFAGELAPYVARVPVLAPYAEELSLAAVVALVSFLSLVLGELVPKSLALRMPEGYALFIGRPLLWLSQLARPVVWFLTASSNVVLRLFGDRTSFTESRLSLEELQQTVEEASRVGTLDVRSGEIASRALAFGELVAREVMMPRARIRAVSKDASPEALLEAVRQSAHTRLPVYEGTIDGIVGYVTCREVLVAATQGKLATVEELLRDPYFVPEPMPAPKLLHELRRRQLPLAFVVDEAGGVSGLVTLEDLVEELVGEIFEEDEDVVEPIRREPSGAAVVAGTVTVRDANRELGLELPEGEGWTTVAGLVLHLAGRMPAAGERYETEDRATLEVVDASARRVRLVRVHPPAPGGDVTGDSGA